MTDPLASLTRHTSPALEAGLIRQALRQRQLVLDLSATREIDSAGAVMLWRVSQAARAAGGTLRLTNVSQELRETLALFPAELSSAQQAPRSTSWLMALGESAACAWTLVLEALALTADVCTFVCQLPWRRSPTTRQMVITHMAQMGSQAAGVVGLIAFLVGVTVALQSAVQLRNFGANILVADLLVVAVTRELGPLLTAIVVAGRSGSAVAAELATMVITEEIDALKTMGINPTRYIVVPKLVALVFTQPILTVLANALAIAGGLLVAVFYLDVAPDAFFGRMRAALELRDVITGLIKSTTFAALIVLTGAVCGLRTKGGADAVGRSTTQSVVAAIFAIIVADALFSLIFYFGV